MEQLGEERQTKEGETLSAMNLEIGGSSLQSREQAGHTPGVTFAGSLALLVCLGNLQFSTRAERQ